MGEINISGKMSVELIDCMGSDLSIVQAMLVSTMGQESLDIGEEGATGRINFLMKNRHGTPFEHNSMTFYVKAPIFVFREFHRHRIGWSYNEVSARYRKMLPLFYVPPAHRPLVQEGKPGAYEFVEGNAHQYNETVATLEDTYQDAYDAYLHLLDKGIAKEIARAVLPVGIYTEMFATCNARSLMAFLSLRTKDPTSTFPSYPQWEIEQVARQMEEVFSEHFPITYDAFNSNGRVCP